MQEGYQIVELKNRVSDVLTQMSIKVSDVLTFLGQRCADSYQLIANCALAEVQFQANIDPIINSLCYSEPLF